MIGISGSGKSTVVKEMVKKGAEVVCPDQIRKELYGSISEQGNGNQVFAIAKDRISKYIKEDKDVVFDATNTNWKRNIEFIKSLKNEPSEVVFIFMMDSMDLELCQNRVKKDIVNDVDRSNVPMDIIERQHKNFENCYKNAMEYDFPSNWDYIEYTGDTELLIYKLGLK
jgi:predicted kinase